MEESHLPHRVGGAVPVTCVLTSGLGRPLVGKEPGSVPPPKDTDRAVQTLFCS